SSAPAAGARRSRHRPHSAWGSNRLRISPAASANGRRPAARSTRRLKRPRREGAFARLIGAISKIRLRQPAFAPMLGPCTRGRTIALPRMLGNKTYSPWSFRPWIAMRNAGIPFSETVISLNAPEFKPQVTKISGTGKVPALADGDVHVWESLAILEYLAEKFP